MAKKTRTELSTLALNTNLPDNTTELITPTTERAQLTDERESVVNYKDDLGGVPNAGKFLTVAVDGESLTMVDEPSGVPDWVTFQTAAINLMKLLSGTTSVQIQFLYDDAGVDTIGARITFDGTSKTLLIGNDFYTAQIQVNNQFTFSQGGAVKLRIETTGDLTHNADIMALNAQQAFGSNPLYTLKFQGKVTGPSGGSFTFEEFANIKGGKENATENDKAGYLSFTTGIADGTLTERLRISSGGDATFSGKLSVSKSSTDFIAEFQNTNGTNPYGARVKDATSPANNYPLFSVTNSGGTAEYFRVNSGTGVVNSYYGIAFPNQSAGSGTVSSSTLDAYEEGTWTPVLQGAGTAGSYTLTNYGSTYTRVGRLVSISFTIQISAIGSVGSAYAQIAGLPYTKPANQQYNGSFRSNATMIGQYVTLIFITTGSTDVLYFSASGSGGGDVQISSFSVSDFLSGTITYEI